MFKRQTTIYYILTLVFFTSAAFLNLSLKQKPIEISKQESALNLQTHFLKFSFAGYKRLVADTLWITTLLESDLSHYKKKDLNNWMFLRFNSIVDLDPLFLDAYTFGGQYLSIIKDDLHGASTIFEKGLIHYPKNYSLNFNAAFLYGMELQEYKRAVELYKAIRDYPQAPKFIDSLIAKLEFEQTGDLSTAFQVLNEIYKGSKKDQLLKEKLEKDLYAIKATIDLECLNGKKVNCERKDFYGGSYIYRNGVFKAQQPFAPYQLHKKKGAD